MRAQRWRWSSRPRRCRSEGCRCRSSGTNRQNLHHAPVVLQHALAAAGNYPAVAPCRGDHQRAFAERPRLGLLAVNVFAVAAGFDDDDRVPVVGRRDDDRVDRGFRRRAWLAGFLVVLIQRVKRTKSGPIYEMIKDLAAKLKIEHPLSCTLAQARRYREQAEKDYCRSKPHAEDL